MFDIGWTELIVVAIVAILVVGPKDLPGMLRGFGRTMGNLRRMARDFQRQFDDALRDAELDEIRKAASTPLKPLEEARKSMKEYQDQVQGALKDSVHGEASDKSGKSADDKAADSVATSKKQPAKSGGPAAGKAKKSGARAAKTKPAATRSGGAGKARSAGKAARPKPAASAGARAKPAAAKSTRRRKTAKSGASATGNSS